MILFLLTLAVLWLILKVITLFIEIPFKIIKLMFSLAGTVVFWVVIAALVLAVL